MYTTSYMSAVRYSDPACRGPLLVNDWLAPELTNVCLKLNTAGIRILGLFLNGRKPSSCLMFGLQAMVQILVKMACWDIH